MEFKEKIKESIEGLVRIEMDEKEKKLLEELIEYLQERQPYPKDIFVKEIAGRAAGLGWNNCILTIQDFIKEKEEDELYKKEKKEVRKG